MTVWQAIILHFGFHSKSSFMHNNSISYTGNILWEIALNYKIYLVIQYFSTNSETNIYSMYK